MRRPSPGAEAFTPRHIWKALSKPAGTVEEIRERTAVVEQNVLLQGLYRAALQEAAVRFDRKKMGARQSPLPYSSPLMIQKQK